MRSIKRNRYGDPISYETINPQTIKVSGYDRELGYRSSVDDNGVTTMFDPSGGPYISVGDEFGGGIVSAIEIFDNHIIVKLK